MTLVVDKVYRVHCLICDWMHDYHSKDLIPKECPACGGNQEGWTKIWELRKEAIHKRLRAKYEHLSGEEE